MILQTMAEIMILPLGRMPKRALNENIGVELICGFKKNRQTNF